MKIFTFWEPKENLPAYLKLCMNTWKKNIPNAEIILLDKQSIADFIDLDFYGPELFSGKFSLPMIADALRALLLYKHGGLWLDCDTIITSPKFVDLIDLKKNDKESYDCSFFGNEQSRNTSISVIYAQKGAELFERWTNKCKDNIKNYKNIGANQWSYLGNYCIDDYIKKNVSKVKIIDMKTNHSHAEMIIGYGPEFYRSFYFKCNKVDKDLHKDTKALLLHNSWTPPEFKTMSENDFLESGCTLSNILAVLNGKTPHPEKFAQPQTFDEKGNVYKLVKLDNTIVYNPIIPGLNISFVGQNGLIELHEPLGTYQGCFINCGTNSKVVIQGTTQRHFRHGLRINAQARNSTCLIGKDFGCWGVAIDFLDEPNLNVSIGDDCIFATGITIRPNDNHTLYDVRTKLPINKGEDIFIGNHVWIATDVKVNKGVKIPNNTTISSNTKICSKFTEENTVIGGYPAKVLKRNVNWDRRCYSAYLDDYVKNYGK